MTQRPNKFRGRPPLNLGDLAGARILPAPDAPQHQVGVQHFSTPLASPGCMAVNSPGQSLLYVFGGLTKLEQAAIHIAAGDKELSPEGAVVRAQAVLEACAKQMVVISQEMAAEAEAEQASPIAMP